MLEFIGSVTEVAGRVLKKYAEEKNDSEES